jgi:hypothetical protein
LVNDGYLSDKQDHMSGSDHNDTFYAEVSNRYNVSNSLSSGDTIDGRGGNDDTLELTSTDADAASTNTAGTIKVSSFSLNSVENFLFRAFSEMTNAHGGGVGLTADTVPAVTDLTLNQVVGLRNFILDKSTANGILDLVPSYGSHASDIQFGFDEQGTRLFSKTVVNALFPESKLVDLNITGNGDFGTRLVVDYQDDVVRSHSYSNNHRSDVQNIVLNNFGDAEYLPIHWTRDPLAIVELDRTKPIVSELKLIGGKFVRPVNDGVDFHKEFVSGVWDYTNLYDFGSAGLLNVGEVEIFNIRTEGRESAVRFQGDDLHRINLDLQQNLHIVSDANDANVVFVWLID